MSDDLVFDGRCFCFTGKLADLKRTAAEREARARGALTTKVVNPELDYLVVGSIPATGWKFGNYGRKIEAAQQLLNKNGRSPVLISESEFMDALATTPPTNSGAVDGKVIVVNYSFTAPSRNSFNKGGVEELLNDLSSNEGCHVRTRVVPVRVRNQLFGSRGGASVPDDYLIFEFRIVKHSPLDSVGEAFAQVVAGGFEAIDGVDGDLHWFERIEGSADYVRLLKEVPQELRVPGI